MKRLSNGEGGPRKATEEDVANYVTSRGGHRVIRKILIANNGIAAVKEIRSVRRWAYEVFGDETTIQFVAMATPEDLAANAEYIRMADEVVEVPGGSNNNNYANVDLIVDIAERTGSQAVWAGWGHASENPLLPDSLARTPAGIAFIGPPGSAMRALGDKIASTVVAQSAKVPCLPWSGSGLTLDSDESNVPQELYMRCCVTDVQSAEEAASKIGYPVMLKASEGGGGKGIRKVLNQESVAAAYRQVVGEVPGSPVFIMKLAPKCRHLEVQLLADEYGNALSLFGRDCSVQRRHQKIIEEGPVTIASRDLQRQMEQAAVRLAKQVGYVSAGTVEYLYFDGQYYFLELNPRLQVEHPVSEMITNVNLPAAQLHVAMGIPLNRIPDIRKLYGLDMNGDSEIDFASDVPQTSGHVIAVRITAENPDEGFKPTSGVIRDLNFRSTTNVWGYFSVTNSSHVHEYADSQFGHLFSRGDTRENARKNMVVALKEMSIHGDIRTTVEYIIKLLETETFIANAFSTSWLDELIATKDTSERPDILLSVICGAIVKCNTTMTERLAEFNSVLERGQGPSFGLLTSDLPVELIYDSAKYQTVVTLSAPNAFTVVMNNSAVEAEFHSLSDGGMLIRLGGRSHVIYAKEEPTGLRLSIDGKTCMFTSEYDPTRIRSSTPGKIVRKLVEDKTHVAANTPIVEIEVMKMYLALVSPEAGVITFTRPEGAVVEAGSVLATLELDDPSQVRRAVLSDAQLPKFETAKNVTDKPNQRIQHAIKTLSTVLNGYGMSGSLFETKVVKSVENLVSALRDPLLPLMEVQECMSANAARIPKAVSTSITNVLESYRSATAIDQSLLGSELRFPVAAIHKIIEEFRDSLTALDQGPFMTAVTTLLKIVDTYINGREGHSVRVISDLLESYLQVEKVFDVEKRREEILLDRRNENSGVAISTLLALARSHNALKRKNTIVVALMNEISKQTVGKIESYVSILHEFAGLSSKGHSIVALQARHLLIKYQLPSFNQRKVAMEEYLRSALTPTTTVSEREEKLMGLADKSVRSTTIVDVLVTFFSHPLFDIQRAALEVYVWWAYRAYEVHNLKVAKLANRLKAEWVFRIPNKRTINANDSSDNLAATAAEAELSPLRYAMMIVFASLNDFKHTLGPLLEAYKPPQETCQHPSDPTQFVNVLNVAITMPERTTNAPDSPAIEDTVDAFQAVLSSKLAQLNAKCVRRITLILIHPGLHPEYYTFRAHLNYVEDRIYRHIEPPLAFQIEIQRLRNYNIEYIPTENKSLHVYYAEEKVDGRFDAPAQPDRRFFVRVLVRHTGLLSGASSIDFLKVEGERYLSEALDSLELLMADSRFNSTDCNHVFMNLLPDIVISQERMHGVAEEIVTRHANRLWKLRINSAEVLVRAKLTPESRPIPLRIQMVTSTGFVIKYHIYAEMADATTGDVLFHSVSPDGIPGPWNGQKVNTPYTITDRTQPRRFAAQRQDTAYVYDLPELFKKALEEQWRQYANAQTAAAASAGAGAGADGSPSKGKSAKSLIPEEVIQSVELVLTPDKSALKESYRPPGQNKVGMVAWQLTLHTPESPQGRDIILISNDITHQIGSFGVEEDIVFKKASERARALGIPRIYLAANSGARIGLAEEVKALFRVQWKEPADPSKGFDYLYVNDDEYNTLAATNAVVGVREEVDGQTRWRLTDVIGSKDGLGVENLRGSGMIAGESSQAYDDIFTLSVVTARTVGIGAYLVRLGQRTIQNKNHPILLTGAPALNKLLGREVYTSNDQLGGVKVMYYNGVSHLVATNNMEAIHQTLMWLSYIPRARKEALPLLVTNDPIDRPITYSPTVSPYDPRWMIGGVDSEKGWRSGFFDRGSFMETLAGWAKTVVTGRARLGGMPVAVIAVETRTVETTVPADPATPGSTQRVRQEAGQVWYPNSAFKTAQAINDFNREELPLIIFANWRGFSGGMRDMFDEVMKFGALIVDGLRAYKQPVEIYIPPHGELRGGAWVVVDPTINAEGYMEMFAAPTSRGGVLEPEGIVEIKYRNEDILKTMRRLDPELLTLYGQLKECQNDDAAQRNTIRTAISKREAQILPIYQQVAVHFADLHDTPVRMQTKGVISAVVPWEEARRFFHARISRRVKENHLVRRIMEADPRMRREHALTAVRGWFEGAQAGEWSEDATVASWLDGETDSIAAHLKDARRAYLVAHLQDMLAEDPSLAKELSKRA